MFLQKDSRRSFIVYSLVFIFLTINQKHLSLSLKYQDTQWSPPQTIPLYDPETWPPILIADHNRTVHAFSSQWTSGDNGEALRAIFYNRWTLEHGWTIPNDIILSPEREARITDAYLDNYGIMHVVFWGGDNTQAVIYYSNAPAAVADNSRAWSTPIIIGENAGDPEGAVFVEDNQGTLYVIFYGREPENGLYIVNSGDGGVTWSQPNPIFTASTSAPLVWNIDVIKDDEGSMYAIWNVLSTDGQGRGIYFASSKNGKVWNVPILLASAYEGYGTQTPAIVEHDGIIFVFFSGISMCQSIDNGLTWSSPVRIFPRHVGVNGSLSPVIDSDNVLHLFFGQRIPGSPDIHGMWHSVWKSDRWTEPEAIIRGPAVKDSVGEKSFDPYEARAVVIQGNVILVTWRTDPGIKGNGVWYSYKILDAPELPVAMLKNQITREINPTPISTTSNQESGISSNKLKDSPELFDKRPPGEINSNFVIVAGAIPVILIILSLVIIKIARNK